MVEYSAQGHRGQKNTACLGELTGVRLSTRYEVPSTLHTTKQRRAASQGRCSKDQGGWFAQMRHHTTRSKSACLCFVFAANKR